MFKSKSQTFLQDKKKTFHYTKNKRNRCLGATELDFMQILRSRQMSHRLFVHPRLTHCPENNEQRCEFTQKHPRVNVCDCMNVK